MTPEQLREVQTTGGIISLSLGIGSAIVAGVVAFLLGKPPERKRSMDEDDRAYRRTFEEDERGLQDGNDRDLPPPEPPDEHVRPKPE